MHHMPISPCSPRWLRRQVLSSCVQCYHPDGYTCCPYWDRQHYWEWWGLHSRAVYSCWSPMCVWGNSIRGHCHHSRPNNCWGVLWPCYIQCNRGPACWPHSETDQGCGSFSHHHCDGADHGWIGYRCVYLEILSNSYTCNKTKMFFPCSLQMVPTTLVVCTLPHSVVAALLVCECQHCPIMFLKDWRPSQLLSKYLLKPPPTTESQPAHLTLHRSTLQMLPVSLAFMQHGQITYVHSIALCR